VHGPPLAHFRPAIPRVLEKDMIELRALDLEGVMHARETPLPEDENCGLAAVADVELRTELSRKTLLLERGHQTHFLKNLAIIRQQRFADVKAREHFFLEQQHFSAAAREVRGRGASARATPDHQHIKTLRLHALH